MARKRNSTTANGTGTVEDNAVTVAIEDVESEPEAVEVPALRLCECGCGQPVVGKKAKFATGHDMKLKSALLVRYDAGDEAAGQSLVDRGWRSWAELAERGDKAKVAKANPVERQRERLTAKLERLEAQADRLRAEIANLG